MLEEHLLSWVEYNELKHQTHFNPHKFHNRINEITTQSQNFNFDIVTKNGLISQMNS